MKKNRLNRLEYLKKLPVRFGSGFIRMKPINSNRTEPVHIKKSTINRKMKLFNLVSY
jgi:hypothetical protein